MTRLRTARRLALLLLLCLATPGCFTINLPSGRVTPLVETTLEDGTESGPKVLLLEIDGVIQERPENPGFFGFDGEGMVGRLREELNRASQDEEVRALLLRIDSPGGTASGSDLIYQEILRFKKERRVPVVAQLMGLATSGGYYVAQAADAIYAQPTTVTGSIGVVVTSLNLSGLMEKIGIADQTFTSGDFKDSGSLLRPMRPDERAQIQSVVDDLYARFVEVVQTGRPELSPDRVRALADGRVYSAPQALAAGLVDEVGSLDEAVAEARRRAGISGARVVTYHRQREYANNFYTMAPPAPASPRLAPSWLDRLGAGPAFLYLWAPGFGL